MVRFASVQGICVDKRTIPGGFLIAVEGIDGGGKTTLVSRLEEMLAARFAEVISTKEPTHGRWGNQLRDTAQSGRLTGAFEMDLMLKDRAEHVEELIAPALARGAVVILDRYFYSSIAYQGSAGIEPRFIEARNLSFAPLPDLVLLLDLPSEIGLGRVRARGDVANAFERADTLDQARELFRKFLPERPRGRLIDARQTADEVYQEALTALFGAFAEALGKRTGLSVENADLVLALISDSTSE